MYYYRNLDPDNNEEVSFDFTTQNTIVSQPGSGCNLAHVSATQSTPWSSYIGLAAIGANWRADYGGFSNRDASDLWIGGATGSGTFTQTVGSTNFADEGISLAYRIQNLLPGATETFKFLVILDAASANNAINNVLYFTYPGSATAPPSVCTPWNDTVRTCGGPVPISITGPIVSDYSWTWSPTAGLIPSTGPNIVANPSVTTTYTATGTPLTTCVNPITMTFVVEVTPGGGNNPMIVPVAPVCQTSPAFNLSVDSLGGTWLGTGITNSTLGTFNPASAGPGTHLITYYTSNFCNNTDTLLITVLGTASATITQPAAVCENSAPFNLTAAATGGTWSGTGITNASLGTFDPTTTGAFTIQYDIAGSCPSTDTVIVTVNPIFDATITQPAPICVASPAFNLSAIDIGGTWTGIGITSAASGTFNPATAGVGPHLITYTISGPCPATDTVIVTVLAVYNATITNVSPMCITAPAFNMSAVSPGGTWTGTGITNAATGTFDPATAGAGVHVITYTISGLCGTSDTEMVTVIPLPVISLVADTTKGCAPTTISFIGYTDQTGGTYAWDFGVITTLTDTSSAATPSYQYVTAGIYTVSMTYTNSIGCVSDTVSNNLITIYAKPIAGFSSFPQSADILEPTVNFLDQSISVGAITNWSWTFEPGATSIQQNPTYIYSAAGAYSVELIITNVNGCMDTVDNYVIIDPVYLYYAPNAFTPDGDGLNDVFMVKGESIDPNNFEMLIFDRWGEKIFRSTDINTGWNGAKNNSGTVVEQGVYVYKVVLKDWAGKRHQYIGHVTIVK
jgi:gliding motility-associated-like protein